jgi:hypothetical protein
MPSLNAMLDVVVERGFHEAGWASPACPIRIPGPIGLLARLAKQPRNLPPRVLRKVAEKVWEAVKATN